MPVRCICDIEKPLKAGTAAAHQMSIASAEPDQHHGSRLITTCPSLTMFTDLPGVGIHGVGRPVLSLVLGDHIRLSTVKDLVRLQA